MSKLTPTLKNLIKDTIKSQLISRLPPTYKLDIYNASARISPKYKYIYIHIPRTGGTSIARILDKINSSNHKKNSSQTFWSNRVTLYKHAQASEMKSWLGEDVWRDFFSFAFVRNPWDLNVSLYHYWLQLGANRRSYFKKSLSDDAEAVKKMGSFTNFVKSDYGELLLVKKGSMYDWISENDQIIVDFIGRFENMRDDWHYICEQIGIEPISLPHTNESVHKSYREYYTEETQQIVANRFQKTIKLFDYSF